MAFEMESPALASGASGIAVHATKLNCPEDSQAGTAPQAIRADLVGSSTCSAAGITATSNTPVLVLCRRLLAAGLDPDTAVLVYRGAVLALRVRSIGEAARLTV